MTTPRETLHDNAARLVTAFCALAGIVACDVFDASLEARLSAPPPGGQSPIFLASSCTAPDLPLVESSETPRELPLAQLKNSAHESGECAISHDVLGLSDGFFRVSASVGQRWHFHLDPAPGQDLAVFASPSCDLRECVAAADVCGTNESEHFTFVAEKESEYIVVVDGIDPEKIDTLQILAISPECGDNNKVHGEVCDDGNLVSGDGCDNACRAELSGTRVDEVEPNDDTYLANVLTAELKPPLHLNGKLGGGTCQPDFFLFRVQRASLLTVEVKTGAGTTCEKAPALSLSLSEADQLELRDKILVAEDEGSDGTCPVLSEVALQPGTFFLRLARIGPSAQFDYRIEIGLEPTPSK